MRQPEPTVRSYAVTLPAGAWAVPTRPGWHQVLLPARGVLRVRTVAGAWVVPRDRAILVPDGSAAEVAGSTAVDVRALYLAADRFALGASAPRALAVRPLLRELLLDAVERAPSDPGDAPRAAASIALLLDELRAAPRAPLHLPWPTDPRARRVADAVAADPAADLVAVASDAGLARRTLERLFARETGLSPAVWRRRARIAASLGPLADGRPVTAVALDVGYATPSAFTAAFRRELGRSPKAYALELAGP